MKPRLRYFIGIWHCCFERTWMGFGYSPIEAYKDWIHVNKVRMHAKN